MKWRTHRRWSVKTRTIVRRAKARWSASQVLLAEMRLLGAGCSLCPTWTSSRRRPKEGILSSPPPVKHHRLLLLLPNFVLLSRAFVLSKKYTLRIELWDTHSRTLLILFILNSQLANRHFWSALRDSILASFFESLTLSPRIEVTIFDETEALFNF